MGFTGLDDFEAKQESQKFVKSESPYFKLEKGQKVRIRPLVELSVNAKSYDPDKGTANFVKEYTNPVKYWLKIVDTYDPETGESCVGHEMVQEFGWYAKNPKPNTNQHSDTTKKWNPTNRFYLPVLVDRLDDSEPTVEVLQLTKGEKSPSQALVDFHKEKNTIMDRWWTYSRNGKPGEDQEMQDVVYKFIPDDPSKFDVKKFEVPNVNDEPYVNNVPYEAQREFLQIDQTYRNLNQEEVTNTSSSSSPKKDEDW